MRKCEVDEPNCEEGYTDEDCIKKCGKDRFDCIYWQDKNG